MRWLSFAIVALGVFVPSLRAAGLEAGPHGTILLDGKPVHCVGVNYFDCFYNLVGSNDASFEQGFAALGQHHIPFARFMACGYWASEMKLYRDDRPEYFRRLDRVVDAAGKNHVGLIPSLFWAWWTVPDLVGESCDQWGNPQSKTREIMRTYTREIVTRYKDSPVIWAWEFGNEYNLATDLPSDIASRRPPLVIEKGTARVRTEHDELTSDIVASAVKSFAEEVRTLDPHRLILSGHSIPRASASHLRTQHKWERDTPAEQSERLQAENPPPVDAISLHIYEDDDLARLPALTKAAADLGRPLVIGEFGVSAKTADGPRKFTAMFEAVMKSNAPLAAVWGFDHPAKTNEWSITFDNDRAYQIQAIEAANRAFSADSPDHSNPR